MKRLFLIFSFAVFAIGQTGSNRLSPGEIRMTALAIDRESSITHLKGNVEISADGMVLRSDEADYSLANREIVARGNVRVKLTH